MKLNHASAAAAHIWQSEGMVSSIKLFALNADIMGQRG